MIPVGAIIAAVVIVARYAVEANKTTTETTTTKRRTFQGRSFGFALVWIFLWPIWLGALYALIFEGPYPVAIAIALALTPICIPWLLVRAVFIPLGLPRGAWAITHLAAWTWGRDAAGGAMIAAVLAAGSRRRQKDLAWARDRLQRLDLLSGAGVVAAALLADIDGDTARARALFQSFESFDDRVVPKTARHIAIEHHLLELLRNGEFTAAGDVDVKGSRFGLFARRCARRFSGVDDRSPISDLRLRVLWLLAPRRRRTRTLLQDALRADPQKQRAEKATTTPAAPLPHALALHVIATQTSAPTLADVQALASAWDPALKAATSDLVARARALGVHDVDDVTRGIEETVTASLCDLVAALDLSAVDVKAQPVLLQTAVERVRSERMDALETATAALRLRNEQTIDLAAVDELREVAALRALYVSVQRTGADARAVAYDAAQWTLCEVAVRLWNVRAEHRLANAMFRMLLDEAIALKDTRGIETQTANVKCGP
ncbi:MAG: hypothetical protein Q8O67_29700 [Deltaproteobacteria bacterium]|nr:hypothetical protein [Deltaproteobacteria bacterium]